MDFGRECLVFVQGNEKTDEIAYLCAAGASMNVRYKNKDFMYSYDTNSATVFYVTNKIDLEGIVVYQYNIPLSDVREVYQFDGFYSIYFGNGRRTYPAATIRFVPNAYGKSKCPDIMEYFGKIASLTGDESFGALSFVHPESVLFKYLNTIRSSKGAADGMPVFFPFDYNLCEKEAVKNALVNDISIIEGPHGSLRVETVLNLILNLAVLGNQTVAYVSGNTADLDLVYKRMRAEGYDILVARPGREDLNIACSRHLEMFSSEGGARLGEISDLNARLEKHMALELREKKLQEQLAVYQLEQKHFKEAQGSKEVKKFETFPLIKWNQEKKLNLWADLQLHLLQHKKTTIWTKIRYFLKYCIYGFEQAMTNVDESIYTLQKSWIDEKVAQLDKELKEVRRDLGGGKYKSLLESQKELSTHYAKRALYDRYNEQTFKYNNKNYRDKGYFEEFLRRFPVIMNPISSVKASIRDNYLFDYMIIDNSSKTDLLASLGALSCCRKAVIIGDSKQLVQFGAGLAGAINNEPDELAYNFFEQSLMSSFINLYQNSVPRTLLNGQYQRHPDSVRFFSEQYYENKLISYSEPKDIDDIYSQSETELIRDEILDIGTRHLGFSDHKEADIAKYIEYLTMEENEDNKSIPVSHLLYKDYNAVLLPKEKAILKKWKYKSSNKVYTILSNILNDERYKDLYFNYSMRLSDIIRSDNYSAGDEEFIKNSVVGFTVYSKFGQKPLLVIESDGFALHKNSPEQEKRDRHKEALLKKNGVKTLRLPVDSSNDERLIAQSIERVFCFHANEHASEHINEQANEYANEQANEYINEHTNEQAE